MSFKTIMAPMMGEEADKKALDAALTMAGPTDAHIQAVFLHRDLKESLVPHVINGLGAGIIDSLVQVAEEEVEHARRAARSSYDTWRQASGIGEKTDPAPTNGITAELSMAMGDLGGNLAKAGRMADVICVVRPGKNDGADWGTLILAALMETGRAVLLAPADTKMKPIESVAIAWNGSREAARAVALAMPVLEAADSVTVLAGTSDYLKPEDVTAFTESLKWHGVNATARMFALNGADLAGRLQAEAREADAQLLVLGAYSHSRLREFVFGGVTDDIIKAGRMPVLMAH